MDKFPPVYAYINIEHSVVAWNAYRGVLVSAVAERKETGFPISMMFAELALNLKCNENRLHNELLREKIRQKHFKKCISRLSGVYFFEDIKAARTTSTWGGDHFTQEYFSELFIHPGSQVSRHDANWITYAPCDDNGRLLDRCVDGIRNYWNGAAYPDREPVWELIVNGRATICNTELRKRAYDIIVANDPESVCILEVGRIAAEVGSDLGQTCAYAVKKEDGLVYISFYLNMCDGHNTEFLNRIASYTGPKNFKDLAVGGDFFRTPKTRDYHCEFQLPDYDTAIILSNIHTVG